MRFFLSGILMCGILAMPACKKKDDNKEPAAYPVETYSKTIPINDNPYNLFSEAAYEEGEIIFTGFSKKDGGLDDALLVVVDSNGTVLLSSSYPDFRYMESPVFLAGTGYACLAKRKDGIYETVIVGPGGNILNRFTYFDRIFPLLNIGPPSTATYPVKLAVNREGDLLLTANVINTYGNGTFIAKLDVNGTLKKLFFRENFRMRDLSVLPNGKIMATMIRTETEEGNLMLIGNDLDDPTYVYIKPGDIFFRPGRQELYVGGSGEFNLFTMDATKEGTFQPSTDMEFVNYISVANDGDLLLCFRHYEYDYHRFSKCKANGMLEWSYYQEDSPVGDVVFVHHMKSGAFFGISQKRDGPGGSIDLLVFKMNRFGKL